jgi:hypothetical protein
MSDFKKILGKSKPNYYVRTSLSEDKTLQTPSSKVDWSRKSESHESLTVDDLQMFALMRLPVTQ